MNEERRKMLDELEAKNRKYMSDLTDTYIKKLAVTTGIYDCILDPYDKLNNGNQESSIMCDLERFAQMIINECVDVGAQYADRLIEPTHYDFVNKKIKQHFGVK